MNGINLFRASLSLKGVNSVYGFRFFKFWFGKVAVCGGQAARAPFRPFTMVMF